MVSECFGKQYRQRILACAQHSPEMQERTCYSPSHCSIDKQTTVRWTDLAEDKPLALMTRPRALQTTSYFRFGVLSFNQLKFLSKSSNCEYFVKKPVKLTFF
jgi:hypothetical protein